MKLKNKKTGEVVEAIERGMIDIYFYSNEHEVGYDFDRKTYNSLSELNSEWEDYKPKEPLINDEKIRKAVRAWAEANEIETAEYDEYWVSFRRDDKTIGFKDEDRCLGFYGLKNSRDYTIEELCGEEEE